MQPSREIEEEFLQSGLPANHFDHTGPLDAVGIQVHRPKSCVAQPYRVFYSHILSTLEPEPIELRINRHIPRRQKRIQLIERLDSILQWCELREEWRAGPIIFLLLRIWVCGCFNIIIMVGYSQPQEQSLPPLESQDCAHQSRTSHPLDDSQQTAYDWWWNRMCSTWINKANISSLEFHDFRKKWIQSHTDYGLEAKNIHVVVPIYPKTYQRRVSWTDLLYLCRQAQLLHRVPLSWRLCAQRKCFEKKQVRVRGWLTFGCHLPFAIIPIQRRLNS